MALAATVAEAIRNRLANHVLTAPTFNLTNVYMAADGAAMVGEHAQFVRIIPGPSSRPHRRSAVPIERGSVRVVVYSRVNLDQAAHADVGQTNVTIGLEPLVALVERVLANSYLDGLLLVGLLVDGDDAMADGDDVEGFRARALGVDYSGVATWSVPQTMANGITADRGQEA